MRTLIIIVLAGILLVAAAVTSLYTVDPSEFVYVTQFGRQVAIRDGATEAGLHVKWPWPIQAIQRVDHRLQVFDLPGAELLTHDPRGKTIDKTMTIDAYVCWRIADKAGVDQFIRTVGTPERARAIVGQQISSRLGAEIGNMPLEDLISAGRLGAHPVWAATLVGVTLAGEPLAAAEVLAIDGRLVDEKREQLRQRLLGIGPESQPARGDGLKDLARERYGIAIVDIRLRRFNYPTQVRSAIYERIISERNKKVADYQSQGTKLAEDIKSAAEREARDLMTTARSEEQRLKREADIKADEIRNQAHAKDKDFYAFLQKLQAYQQILGESRDVLLLSSKHEIFDLLLKPPRTGGNPATPATIGPTLTAPAPRKPPMGGGQ